MQQLAFIRVKFLKGLLIQFNTIQAFPPGRYSRTFSTALRKLAELLHDWQLPIVDHFCLLNHKEEIEELINKSIQQRTYWHFRRKYDGTWFLNRCISPIELQIIINLNILFTFNEYLKFSFQVYSYFNNT